VNLKRLKNTDVRCKTDAKRISVASLNIVNIQQLLHRITTERSSLIYNMALCLIPFQFNLNLVTKLNFKSMNFFYKIDF